jgi:hypothetical protein
MKALIRLGADALQPLHERLEDPRIQNEVVLILGAIGDRSTVPLLIDAYPNGRIARDEVSGPDRLRVICFGFALSYLTGQSIGRSREGADFNPSNRELWRAWWERDGPTFVVPATKPNASWVPNYPAD